jgi:hypothetical protein
VSFVAGYSITLTLAPRLLATWVVSSALKLLECHQPLCSRLGIKVQLGANSLSEGMGFPEILQNVAFPEIQCRDA